MDEHLLERLREAVGEKFVLVTADDLEPYTHDECQGLFADPEVAVRPRTTEEVAAVMRLANEARVPVTPRNAGTGKHGGCVPVEGGIVLSLDRMNSILEIDTRDGFAVVEPGVVTETLQEAAAEAGFFYPPDPASKGSCHIGGNILTNAGGMRAVKYGTTRDFVFGLTFVTATGDVVETGGKMLKESSGYQLARLIAGSEGTLGVVTKCVMRLLPKPRARGLLHVPFDSLDLAVDGVAKVFATGITPSACEFMEQAAIEVAARHAETDTPFPGAEAQLIIEVDGRDEDSVSADLMRIGEALLELGAMDVIVATERRKMEALWQVRRVIAEGLKRFTTYRGVDSVVPRSRIADLVRASREVGAAHGLDVVSFGHAGDGNLHINLIRTEAQATDEEWKAALAAGHEALVRAAISLEGSISGEHGIGRTERPLFHLRHAPEAIALMKRIKAAFDPNGILNPGKVLP
ncbi:MAG: FAD-linked oxidase C-terminal domain-containing protein [Planctomycetota bacterium]